MAESDRIRTPWAHKWRRFRFSALPAVTFIACTVLTGLLWVRQGQLSGVVGEVEVVRLAVSAVADGTLAPLSGKQWTLFDSVEADQVVARLDDRPARQALQTLREQLVQLQKELEAATLRAALEQADRRSDRRSEATRLVLQIEQLRLEILDRTAQIEAYRVELQRRNARLTHLEPLHARQVLPDIQWTEEQLLRDEAAKRIEEHSKALSEVKQQRELAEARLRDYPPLETVEVDRLVAPTRAAIAAQESSVRKLQIEIDALEIRAPISGTICEIHGWPGQHVQAGAPVVTIAADFGRYIVSYVRPQQRLRPRAGMAVAVRVRAPGSRPFAAVVERVGPQIEPVPMHQLRDPRTPEWGIPVRISLPDGLNVRPGELVDVRFMTRAKKKAG